MRPFSALTEDLALPGEAAGEDVSSRLSRMATAHLESVWRTLRRLGVPPADIDDAVQQVFLAVVPRLGELPPPREHAYLLGIAVRIASNWRRTHRRRREVFHAPLPDEGDEQAGPEATLEQKQIRRLLDQALDTLPQELRVVFVLFELEELSMSEIARLLDLPPGTVASRLRRAREQFQEQARSQLDEPGEA